MVPEAILEKLEPMLAITLRISVRVNLLWIIFSNSSGIAFRHKATLWRQIFNVDIILSAMFCQL